MDWNNNGRLDASDLMITELLEKELEQQRNRPNSSAEDSSDTDQEED